MKRPNYIDEIKKYIDSMEKGSVFVISDFSHIANSDAVKMALSRLFEEKYIARVMRGVYYIPEYSDVLNEYIRPSINNIAEAVARNYGWTIIPCGDAALNILGISTQVVASWVYFSDGPYKNYECDGYTIYFKHCTNREITNLSYTTAIVVQALKALGRENVSDEVINKLKAKLLDKDKTKLLAETKFVTDWIYETIKRVCEDNK